MELDYEYEHQHEHDLEKPSEMRFAVRTFPMDSQPDLGSSVILES